MIDAPPPPRQYPVTGKPRRGRTSFVDLTGRTFGRWSVLAEAPKKRPGQSQWRCRCACGTEKPAVGYTSLTTGRSKSCGCLKRELQSKPLHEQHGHANPTYRSWHAMKSRPGVCREWQSFDQFLTDMGPRPEGLRLVQRHTDKGWSKDACCWGTRKS